MIFFTLVAWAAYVVDQIVRLRGGEPDARAIAETIGYSLLISLLTASAMAYLLARLGHLQRQREHRRTPRAVIDDHFDTNQPSVTLLVPSYREEPSVIRQTLLSAALQEYPGIRTVLLVDDPPTPSDPDAQRLLAASLAAPDEIADLLREPHDRAVQAMAAFELRHPPSGMADPSALLDLAAAYHDAIDWLRAVAAEILNEPGADNGDAFLADGVIGSLANDLEITARALRDAARAGEARISHRRARQLHRRLVWIFDCDVMSFERKRFASLSHEPNKAMNLNSYLGLMGRSFSTERSAKATVLVEREPGPGAVHVPNSDFVLTLDADSVLLPDYCLRLLYLMDQPENQDLAVMQTPYSAFPGGSRVERMAGATTDVQHLVHQGLTHFGATFWVGANAVIRRSALDELRSETMEDGFPVARFIADRTVIEDTESSIDLRARGWRLENYPERLSYSATPPDFGSLVVQRKRWANGGLVIVPRLWRLMANRKHVENPPALMEGFLRLGYLASISWVSLGLLVLLVYPFDQRLLSTFAIAAAIPYFVGTAADLRRSGYRRRDLLGLYAFNLMLLPVNLAGTMSSLLQAIGGHKVDFARTPKVRGRTSAPMLFILTPLMLLLWSAYTLARNVTEANVIPSVFAGLNLIALVYAFAFYIGPVAAVVDVVLGLRARIYKPAKATAGWEAPVPEWAPLLYVGGSAAEDLQHWAPVALALSARDQSLSAGEIDLRLTNTGTADTIEVAK